MNRKFLQPVIMNRKFLQPVITKSQPVITNLKTGPLWTESKWRTFLTISDNLFLMFVCVDNRSALTLTLLQIHTSLCTEIATYNLYEQTRDGRRRISMEQSEAKIGQIR